LKNLKAKNIPFLISVITLLMGTCGIREGIDEKVLSPEKYNYL
jgi:hypothetical protein